MASPKPKSGEDKNTFVSRCMSEMSGKCPQSQALAICYSQWNEGEKEALMNQVMKRLDDVLKDIDG